MKSKLFVIASLAALLVSCSKQGPVGPQGNQGPQGNPGNNGTNGTNGSANVKTTIFAITTWNTVTSNAVFNAILADADITNADSDAVSVSVSQATNGPWLALPNVNVVSAGDRMEYSYQNGQATITYYYTSAPFPTQYYKVTVIPPAVIKRKNR